MERLLTGILDEIGKVMAGKDDVTRRILRTILAGGHILLDDVPGVGKTTLAVALSRSLDVKYRRVQFTPDVMPSDLVGFSVYSRETGDLVYHPGALHNANLLLCDEINRTSGRTQSALLEAMEEHQVTVDGTTHPLSSPFIVIATQNNVGSAGTQHLPYAQMDRFMVRLSLGQPDKQSLVRMLSDRQAGDPLDQVSTVASPENLLRMQAEVRQVLAKDVVLEYIAELVLASNEHPAVETGISPRAALHLERSARAAAYMDGRDYATGEDVQHVFADVCGHRLILKRSAYQKTDASRVIHDLLDAVPVPDRRN